MSSSPQDLAAASAALGTAQKPAFHGQLGGMRPEKDNRLGHWWGCNALGAPGTAHPRCVQSGALLQPLVQVHVDALSERPASLEGIALLSLWVDLNRRTHWHGSDGDGFRVLAYDSANGLVPLGPGFRESDALPSFPIRWQGPMADQPVWEDMGAFISESVATAHDTDWFFESDTAKAAHTLREYHPVKIGGWPQWIQGADWPPESAFVMQIDSTSKGRLILGDNGSLYLFRTPDGWAIRSDCF